MIRNIIKLAAVVASLTFGGQAMAQNSDVENTNASATIAAAPISVTENSALVFGSMMKPTSGSSTVTLDSTTPACDRTISGNGTLVAGSPSCATYSVIGEAAQVFTIVADTSFDMTRSGGSEMLTVTTNKSAATGTIGQATANFKIGGSFPVTTATVAGSYNGNFNVTVTYQ